MNKYDISVIIPTRNPRPEFLKQVLEALGRQTMDLNRWELLLVDNSSDQSLAGRVNLGWHPHARHLLQVEPGLTPTRIRGIQESRAELVIFVDDDNILSDNYLEQALSISNERPYLGAWSGTVRPEFEVQPDKKLTPYLFCLCIREVEKDVWGNSGDLRLMPWGAGMCVRKSVGLDYSARANACNLNSLLGRAGAVPRGGNDYDLAASSFDLGLGVGLFSKLVVKHLMPKERTTLENILRMQEMGACAGIVYAAIHGLDSKTDESLIDRLVAKYKYFRATPTQRAVDRAISRGIMKGKKIVAQRS